MENVEESLFKNLGEAMEYSSESLYQIMQEYDIERDGTIESKDLVKVIKKLGLMNPEPNIHLIMKAGGCQASNKKIQCAEFASKIEAEIIRRHRMNS
jgi:Ca2+-binding EF-hand superfamily protein